MSETSKPHSVLSDVRNALAAPRGDAGTEARMLALDSVQSLVEQYQALRSAAEYVIDGYDIIEADDAHLSHAVEKLRGVLFPASAPDPAKNSEEPSGAETLSPASERFS